MGGKRAGPPHCGLCSRLLENRGSSPLPLLCAFPLPETYARKKRGAVVLPGGECKSYRCFRERALVKPEPEDGSGTLLFLPERKGGTIIQQTNGGWRGVFLKREKKNGFGGVVVAFYR